MLRLIEWRSYVSSSLAKIGLRTSNGTKSNSTGEDHSCAIRAGQIWTYRTRQGEEDSRIFILDDSFLLAEDRVIHIRVEAVAIRDPNRQDEVQSVVPHIAIFESALKKSLLNTVGSFEVEAESALYVQSWKQYSDGQAMIVGVDECLKQIEREKLRRSQTLAAHETPQEWCCGLPFTQESLLTEEERQYLTDRIKRLQHMGYGLLVFSLGTSVVPLILYCVLPKESTVSSILFGMVMLSCFYVSKTLIKGLADLRQMQMLTIGLSIGTVKVFEGNGHPSALLPRAAYSIKQYFKNDPLESQCITTLSGSDVLFKVNGKIVDKYLVLRSGRVSKPGFARMSVTVKRFAVATVQTGLAELRKRHLTTDEKEELRQHRFQLYWRASWVGMFRVIFGSSATLGLILAVDLWLFGKPTLARSMLVWIPVPFGLAWAAHYAHGELRFASLLAKSEKLGLIAIIDMEDSTSNAPPMEFLPYGNVQWTLYGRPSAWRVLLSE